MSDVAWTVLAAVLMVLGLGGVVIPVLPGLALIWAVALGYGLIVGFGTIGTATMILLTLLLLGSVVLGFVIPKRSTDAHGVRWTSQAAALVGAVIGFFAIPIVGVPVGALLGVLLAERVDKSDWQMAWGSTKALAKGLGINVLVQLVIGFVMIASWSVWAATRVL